MAYSVDYQKLVLDDLKTYKDIARPVHASILERLCVRKLPPKALHPNPGDEFSIPEIGPNAGIINDYMAEYRLRIQHGEKPVENELMIEKISTGGYMLLNGHHRWMAAAKMQLPKVPVTIMNTISEEKILENLNSSDRRMCVSFDLDEVLLTGCKSATADHALRFPYNLLLKRTLRKNAGVLINELQRLGFDVWVYSGSGMSEEEISKIMKLHRVRVNGMVNFMKDKKKNESIRQAFRKKYRLSVHIDNESVMWVDTLNHAYDSVQIEGGINWADDAFSKIRALDILKQIEGEGK